MSLSFMTIGNSGEVKAAMIQHWQVPLQSMGSDCLNQDPIALN